MTKDLNNSSSQSIEENWQKQFDDIWFDSKNLSNIRPNLIKLIKNLLSLARTEERKNTAKEMQFNAELSRNRAVAEYKAELVEKIQKMIIPKSI